MQLKKRSSCTVPLIKRKSGQQLKATKNKPKKPATVRIQSKGGDIPDLDESWHAINQEPIDRGEIVDQRTYKALLEIEHALTRKERKRLATRMYYALFGKDENLSEFYDPGPPVTGLDINGNEYSF